VCVVEQRQWCGVWCLSRGCWRNVKRRKRGAAPAAMVVVWRSKGANEHLGHTSYVEVTQATISLNHIYGHIHTNVQPQRIIAPPLHSRLIYHDHHRPSPPGTCNQSAPLLHSQPSPTNTTTTSRQNEADSSSHISGVRESVRQRAKRATTQRERETRVDTCRQIDR
jgi:hypothetical protein